MAALRRWRREPFAREIGRFLGAVADFGADVALDLTWPPTGHHGERVNDVSERAGADEDDAPGRAHGRTRTRAIRSLVAWSLGSPTSAVLPPYARTTSYSGTRSGEP